jgi:hypothetical protein
MIRRSTLRLLIATAGALALASCGGPPSCPAVYADPQIQIPASYVTTPPSTGVWFSPINAATTSAPDGIMVSIAANQGTVAYGGRGPFPAFIYIRQDFVGDIIYGGLGVDGGVWFPFWLYGTPDGRLVAIYGEMTDQDTDVFVSIEGTWTDQGVSAPQPVSIPAHTLSPVALSCGFTVSAPPGGVDLRSSSVGSISLLGDLSTVYPFHTVDCRSGCGTPGWFEIHSIIWDPVKLGAAFGIIYLDDTGVALGADGIAVPGGAIVGDNLPISGATWSLSR